MRKSKRMQAIAAQYGQAPDAEYFTEDMQGLRTYMEYRQKRNMDPFYLDDTTWRDLSMDDVFKRMNATQSTSGEQYLYYMLRTPAVDAESYRRRHEMIARMQQDEALRLTMMECLARVGKRRAANTSEVFHPSVDKPYFLWITILLMLAIVCCLVGVFFSRAFVLPLLLVAIGNALFYTFMMHRRERDFSTISYTVSLISACRRLRRRVPAQMRETLSDFFAAGGRTKHLLRMGGVTLPAIGDLGMIVNLLFLTDLLSYELLKNRLAKHQPDIFTLHETLGMIDASIAVASYRRSISAYCAPEIDFAPDAPPRLAADAMTHPLLAHPVPNSIDTDQSLLVTGSNASGKSTFLKGVMIAAIMAQSVCTALCASYRATSFYLYSSMAIADNILDGESYFIAEIKSVKRIADAAQTGRRILCVIDEVLRGTNTIERIAASSALLQSLQRQNLLCLAATHDGELCEMLPAYRDVYFAETIVDGGVSFDYQMHEGAAATRNAIRLLAQLGFDPALVQAAEARAQAYLKSGKWHA